MADNSIQRKLSAFFSADVKGYSKLMGDDDEYTVKTITTYRQIISGLIEKHEGRVVDAPGDNILQLNLKFTASRFMQSHSLHDPMRDNRFKGLLKRAGLPE